MGMPDPQKQEYYRQKREERLAYQRKYYRRNRTRIAHKREIAEDLYPEVTERVKNYQRDYFQRNKDRILAKRRETYKRKKVALDTQ
jgi:hypothetical protein